MFQKIFNQIIEFYSVQNSIIFVSFKNKNKESTSTHIANDSNRIINDY